jgi:hypothetical protein
MSAIQNSYMHKITLEILYERKRKEGMTFGTCWAGYTCPSTAHDVILSFHDVACFSFLCINICFIWLCCILSFYLMLVAYITLISKYCVYLLDNGERPECISCGSNYSLIHFCRLRRCFWYSLTFYNVNTIWFIYKYHFKTYWEQFYTLFCNSIYKQINWSNQLSVSQGQ